MVVDDAAHTFLECRTSEIDEQPHRLPRQAKVGQQLFAVGGVQFLDRFDLDQEAVIDEQINTQGRIEASPFEMYVDRLLSLDPIPEINPLAGKTRLIDAFEKSRPQIPVQTKRQIEPIAAHNVYVPDDPPAPP